MRLFPRRIYGEAHLPWEAQSLCHHQILSFEPGDLRVGLCQDGNVSGPYGNIQYIPPTACTNGID